jgi:hypothetical protein
VASNTDSVVPHCALDLTLKYAKFEMCELSVALTLPPNFVYPITLIILPAAAKERTENVEDKKHESRTESELPKRIPPWIDNMSAIFPFARSDKPEPKLRKLKIDISSPNFIGANRDNPWSAKDLTIPRMLRELANMYVPRIESCASAPKRA